MEDTQETTARSTSLNKTYPHYGTYAHPNKMTHASTYYHVVKDIHVMKKLYELSDITTRKHTLGNYTK
jgi:hypothetical protein